MPVPTTVADLSTTIASNSPAGSDNVFPDLDNYLRALSGILASVANNSATNGYTTPYVALSGATMTGALTATKFSPTGTSATGNGMYLPATNTLGWSTNGAEVMRLDSSGNLGIGATPTQKLDIAGSVQIRSTGILYLNNSDNTNQYYWQNIGASGANNATLILSRTNVGETLRIDSSGNLGLGVTPSAWTGSGAKVFELGSKGNALLGNNSVVDVTYNAYFDSAWKYGITGFASYYAQTGGTHQWFTAPSGTAGNAISFTQAMTLTAGGKWLLGTTSSPGGGGVQAVISNVNGGGLQYDQSGAGGAILPNGGSAGLQFYTYTGGIGSETYSERARITSGGDLLVGTTSTGYTSSGSTYFSPSAQYWIGNHTSGTASGTRYWGFGLDVNELGSITQNSTTGVLYNVTSDRRLKNNITPAPNASNDIDAIQIVSHGWKSAPDEHVKYGVIAQDLHAVAPQAVKKGDDGEDIVETWGVDYSKLVPMLIKEIQSLRARLAAAGI